MSVQLPHFQVPKEFVDAIEILYESCNGVEPGKAWSGLQKHCHEVKKNTIRVVHETLKKIGELNQVTDAKEYLDTLCAAYEILYEKDHVSVGARPKTAHTETLKPTKKFAERCRDTKELPGPQLRREIQSLAQKFFANFESFSKTVELQERYQLKFIPKRPTDELGKIRSKRPSEEYMPLGASAEDFSLFANSSETDASCALAGDFLLKGKFDQTGASCAPKEAFSLFANSGETDASCALARDFLLKGKFDQTGASCASVEDFSLLGNSGETEASCALAQDLFLSADAAEIGAGMAPAGEFFLSVKKGPRTRVGLIAQGDSDDSDRSHTPATARRPHHMNSKP
jgi:hypothetical protein